MENKKTTELIDELITLKESDWETGGKYETLIAELRKREPFIQILDQDWDEGIPAVWRKLKELR